jgi:hypothetical protein
MAIFTIEISDERLLDGITAAREVRNSEVEESDALSTNEEYLQFVIEHAADSYAKQHLD